MAAIYTDKLTNGVFWVEIKDADLRLLCGCPADSVKYLIRRKHIRSLNNAGVPTQIGPNALLLADTPLQNGFLSNLGEFPVMHMLYFQGISVPGHPNYGKKRVIIGTSGQIETQLNYMYVGNYGIVDKDLLDKICPSPEFASQLLDTKKRFAHGSFKDYKEFLRTCIIDSDVPAEIVPGVSIRRQSVNVFEIRYKEETCIVDMNLKPGQVYEPTYQLPEVNIPAGKFVIINTGLGDGWDPNRTCFSSMVRFDGRYYLVDVGPNIRYVMKSFGFAPEDIAGIIQTHIHDDHFGGYDFFWNSNQPVQIYSTAPVIASMRHGYTPTRKVQATSTRAVMMPPAMGISYVYFTLKNLEAEDLRLVSVQSDMASQTIISRAASSGEGKNASPQEVSEVIIPANGIFEFKPGGYYVVLKNPNSKLQSGQTINIILMFDNDEFLPVTARIQPAAFSGFRL
ncbi:hypothetical protein CHS0354_006866 [Potamilus streckersoni]|uniref:Metallo-beta-lactamase domain-containing protein n=1 Tax=Potamilus streckersoni TaxID=2493646 RepID=A0AAE0TEA5_9BIVA|nr:hypothetical protein CHS0354_006866 [Potamilus streckersoni]